MNISDFLTTEEKEKKDKLLKQTSKEVSEKFSNPELLQKAINEDELMEDYEISKLEWMIDNGYTLGDLITSVIDFAYQTKRSAELTPDNVVELLEDWENSIGFNGEIYESFDEYCDSHQEELLDEVNELIDDITMLEQNKAVEKDISHEWRRILMETYGEDIFELAD